MTSVRARAAHRLYLARSSKPQGLSRLACQAQHRLFQPEHDMIRKQGGRHRYIRRAMETDVSGRKPRHPIALGQRAQLLRKCARFHDGDRQSLRSNGFDRSQTMADERQTPTAAVSVQRIDGPFPKETTLRIESDWQRINLLDRLSGTGCPDSLFTPQELAPT